MMSSMPIITCHKIQSAPSSLDSTKGILSTSINNNSEINYQYVVSGWPNKRVCSNRCSTAPARQNSIESNQYMNHDERAAMNANCSVTLSIGSTSSTGNVDQQKKRITNENELEKEMLTPNMVGQKKGRQESIVNSLSSSFWTNMFESLLRCTSFLSSRILNRSSLTSNYLIQEINDHCTGVNCLSLSEDLSLLVSGGEDGVVRLWSTFSTPCECIGVLVGHQNYITCCTVYRYLIISGSADCTLRIWRIEDGNCLIILRGHQSFVSRCCTYGPILLSTSFDNTVRVWALTDQLTFVKNDHQESYDNNHPYECDKKKVKRKDLIHEEKEIFSLMSKTKLNITFGQCLYVLEGHRKSVTQVAIVNNDDSRMLRQGVIQELDLVITTSTDGTAQTYKLTTGELRHVLLGHEGPINCLAIDAKETRFIYTAGADSVIKNWDVITGEFIQDLRGHEGSILCMLSHNRILYSGSVDQTVRAWALECGQCIRVYYQNTAPVSCLQYFKGILYTGCNDNCARLYDSNSAVLKQTFNGHSASITALQVIPGKLFTSSYDGRILVWDCVNVQTKQPSSNNKHRDKCVLSDPMRSMVLDSSNISSIPLVRTLATYNKIHPHGQQINSRNIQTPRRFMLDRNKSRMSTSSFSNQVTILLQAALENNESNENNNYEDDDGCLPFLSYYCFWPELASFLLKWRRRKSTGDLMATEYQYNAYLNEHHHQHYVDDNVDSVNVRHAIQALEPYLRSFR